MEEKKYCYKYPHPAVTTDCVIFGFDGSELQVLLIERGIEPFKGKWAFPSGFLKMDEIARVGALRELKEESGMPYSTHSTRRIMRSSRRRDSNWSFKQNKSFQHG